MSTQNKYLSDEVVAKIAEKHGITVKEANSIFFDFWRTVSAKIRSYEPYDPVTNARNQERWGINISSIGRFILKPTNDKTEKNPSVVHDDNNNGEQVRE